jgi:hypothetical protein
MFFVPQRKCRMKSIVIAAAILVSASAVPAQTAPTPQAGTIGPAKIAGETREQKLHTISVALKQMDTNGDERITSEEWIAFGGKKTNFDILDNNKDNILTLQELRSSARKLRAFKDYEAAAPH